jgi:hypothetical protein
MCHKHRILYITLRARWRVTIVLMCIRQMGINVRILNRFYEESERVLDAVRTAWKSSSGMSKLMWERNIFSNWQLKMWAYIKLTMILGLTLLTFTISSNLVVKSTVCPYRIVSDYGLDDRAIGVRFSAGAKDFSSSLCVQTDSGAHPASCPMGTGGPFPGGKSAAWAWCWPLTPI